MLEISRDQLWKAIIEDLFSDFLHWFYQPYVHLIDFERPFEFLDKELQKIYPESVERNRAVDKLVKVWLKNGQDSWFLLHIEAQSYRDTGFAERMYIYQYRIRDLFKRGITALAILADDSPHFRPNAYQYAFMGTELSYQFQICKVRDLKIRELEESDNPFAVALSTAWYGLKRNSRTDEQRYSFKIQLVRRLAERNFHRDRIGRLLEFIKHYSKFELPELYQHFEEEVSPTYKTMGIIELVQEKTKEHFLKQGLQQGLQQGFEEGLKKGEQLALQRSVENLFQKGFTIQQVTDLLAVAEEVVQNIHDEISGKTGK